MANAKLKIKAEIFQRYSLWRISAAFYIQFTSTRNKRINIILHFKKNSKTNSQKEYVPLTLNPENGIQLFKKNPEINTFDQPFIN